MKYLILHGSYGSPEENWFRWLERELKNRGGEVILDQYPVDDWNLVNDLGPTKMDDYQPVQTLAVWEDFFVHTTLPKLGKEPFCFIGHSIAPIFMLHMIQKYNLNLSKAIFVAPFFNIPDRPDIWQFYPVNKTFYGYDFDFGNIRSHIQESHVVYGDNEPYAPLSEPPLFAEKLGSQIHVVPGGGHCGGIFKEFPLVLELVTTA